MSPMNFIITAQPLVVVERAMARAAASKGFFKTFSFWAQSGTRIARRQGVGISVERFNITDEREIVNAISRAPGGCSAW
jgi:hypothetical protein